MHPSLRIASAPRLLRLLQLQTGEVVNESTAKPLWGVACTIPAYRDFYVLLELTLGTKNRASVRSYPPEPLVAALASHILYFPNHVLDWTPLTTLPS